MITENIHLKPYEILKSSVRVVKNGCFSEMLYVVCEYRERIGANERPNMNEQISFVIKKSVNSSGKAPRVGQMVNTETKR